MFAGMLGRSAGAATATGLPAAGWETLDCSLHCSRGEGNAGNAGFLFAAENSTNGGYDLT